MSDLFLSHLQIAHSYGFKVFNAESVDDLTLEQYNVLISHWNHAAREKLHKANPRTVSIQVANGKPGVNYGED